MYFSASVCLVLFLVSITSPCSAQNAYCSPTSSSYSSTNLNSYPLVNQPTPAPNGPELTTSNLVDTSQQAVRDYIVKKHNCLRALPSPTAANMLKMQWNAEAAAGAQQHANNCVFQHNSNANRTTSQFSCGQNIAEVGGGTPMTWKYAIDLWYNEVDSCTDGTASSCTAGDVIGHYTQVVWAKSWQIGCGWANCPDANMNFYVCNYCPAGNYVGQAPYQTGASCSACPNDCSEGKLCTNVLGTNSTATPSPTPRPTPSPTPAPTPAPNTRPDGYDVCNNAYCGGKSTGYYQPWKCTKNLCSCTNGVATMYGCGTGTYFDGVSQSCKAGNATWCPTKTVTSTPTPSKVGITTGRGAPLYGELFVPLLRVLPNENLE